MSFGQDTDRQHNCVSNLACFLHMRLYKLIILPCFFFHVVFLVVQNKVTWSPRGRAFEDIFIQSCECTLEETVCFLVF